jgi:heme exporter protein A
MFYIQACSTPGAGFFFIIGEVVDAAKRLFSGNRLSCARGGRVLFQNLSFGLNPGDVAHLSGPNGAGKTSLLRIMCGALPPVSGKILWGGRDCLKDGLQTHAARYAFLPADDRSLKPLETAGENLAFWAGFFAVPVARADIALEKMGILRLRDVSVRHLSAGQRRRLSLARVFLKDAPLWLLDEPLNGLDMKSYDLFMAALEVHCKGGGMAALASHYAVEPPKHGKLHRVEVA